MINVFIITLDCKAENNPVKRVQLNIEGLGRNDAIVFAEEFMLLTGYKYEVAFVIQGASK